MHELVTELGGHLSDPSFPQFRQGGHLSDPSFPQAATCDYPPTNRNSSDARVTSTTTPESPSPAALPATGSDLELCLVQCKNANATPPSKKLKSTAVPRGFYGTRPTCTPGSGRCDLNCYLSDGLRPREAPPTNNKTRPAEALTGSAVLATGPAQIATTSNALCAWACSS